MLMQLALNLRAVFKIWSDHTNFMKDIAMHTYIVTVAAIIGTT